MREDALKRRLFILMSLMVFGVGLACNDHGLNPFNSTISTAARETTQQAEVRAVDILFVVDNSNSMCEEQTILTNEFQAFIDILTAANADFRLAVINTDMTDFTNGAGTLRQEPGSYQQNAASCADIPDTSVCNGKSLPPFLTPSDYNGLASASDIEQLREDFACMALTGIDGDGTEMGLATMRKALEDSSGESGNDFIRPEALLAVVFVTDENDCSDGTLGASFGPVYSEAQNNSGACEFNRNIEDSCSLTGNNGEFTFEGETKTALEWCIDGNREAVQAGAAEGAILVDCPEGGCANNLTPRREFYDFLVGLKTREVEEDGETVTVGGVSDIIVAGIINQDAGQRFNSSDPRINEWCGTAGSQGYRYELFVEMFPEDQRVVGPICDVDGTLTEGGVGTPVNFSEQLTIIATAIGEAVNSICLQNMPFTCTMDAMPEGETCPAGEVCCPGGQTCSEGPFLAGIISEEGYRLCSGFDILVDVQTGGVDENGDPVFRRLERGTDYSISTQDLDCFGRTGSPLEIQFQTPPSSEFIVTYPRSIGQSVR